MESINITTDVNAKAFSNFVTEKNLAKLMGMSIWTARNLRLKHGLPYIQLGRRYYYDVKIVADWLAKRMSSNALLSDEIAEITVMSNKKPYTPMSKIT